MTSPLEQKIKIKGPVVVTANRLRDGAVVYRAADGEWTTDLSAAAVVTTAPAAQQLLKGAAADDRRAVGAYVAPVELTSDRRILPGNLREQIRVAGPTIEFGQASLRLNRSLSAPSRESADAGKALFPLARE
jgi:Protein of unknown function (DUF2849)